MSTYKGIFGKTIKVLSTDPTDAGAEGQIWYNTTTGSFRTVLSVGAWSSGGNLLSPNAYSAGFGIQTAAIDAGGNTFATTQEYDGSSWSSNPNLNTGRRSLASANLGTVTAGLVFGGFNPDVPAQYANTESWNGTTWSEVNDLPAYSGNFAGFGTQTAAVAFQSPSPGSQSIEWDGTNWGSTAPTNTSRPNSLGNGTGTQTAGLIVGGGPTPTVVGAVEEYDGSTWTSGTSYPESVFKNAVTGVQTSAYAFSGSLFPSPTQPTATNSYNGTTWTAQPTIGSARYAASEAGGSSGTSALLFGGYAGATPPLSQTNATEEFSYSIYSPIAATWASGTNLPSVRWNTSGAGTATAGLVFGGSTGPGLPTFLNSTFEYDGSSWTAGGNTPASRINQFSAGIQTAAIGGGGYNTGNHATAYTYDGSSWTTITNTPYATKGAGAGGTSTAALIFGSDIAPSDNQDSYSWNGASWTEEGALNNTFSNGASGGPTENTTFAAGSEYSPQPSTRFETYDGSSWTSGPSLNTLVGQNRGFGSSSNCLSIGGFNIITGVEKFDGTSWATTASLGTGRKQFAAANFTASGVSNGWVGGGADGDASVETFTGETTAANLVDITTAE